MKTIAGKWNVAGRDGVVWEFTVFQHFANFTRGRLREWSGDRLVNRTEYDYYPADRLLIVDRSDLQPDGFVWICYEELYRIEKVDINTLKIHRLQEW